MRPHHQGHWKELVALARGKNAQKPEEPQHEQTATPDKAGSAPQMGSRRDAARRFYREYFQRYRYVWLAASLVILAVCLGVTLGTDGTSQPRAGVRPSPAR